MTAPFPAGVQRPLLPGVGAPGVDAATAPVPVVWRPPVIAYIAEFPFNLRLRGPVPHEPVSRARAGAAVSPVAGPRPPRPPGGRAGGRPEAPVR